jgi:hypothetical protein
LRSEQRPAIDRRNEGKGRERQTEKDVDREVREELVEEYLD